MRQTVNADTQRRRFWIDVIVTLPATTSEYCGKNLLIWGKHQRNTDDADDTVAVGVASSSFFLLVFWSFSFAGSATGVIMLIVCLYH